MSEPVRIELTTQAEKDLKGLWKVSEKVTQHLKALKTNPRKGHPLSGSLQGVRALEFTMKGSGQFRAAYFYFPDENAVIFFLVGPHENFYQMAEKRVKFLKDLLQKARAVNKNDLP